MKPLGDEYARYEIRGATRADHADVASLARHLNSVNLPDDSAAIAQILDVSERSFSGEIASPSRREHVFVLVDRQTGSVVGTSMLIGQLGSRDAPYVYFDVSTEERYSTTLDRHFAHQVLSLGLSYDGPTEIGGLVLHPDYRRKPERLGKLISYVRFLFIAMHRDCFRDETVAELMPPLLPDGTSHLWEAVGRRFTGMDYLEADRLSKRNKEFVRSLFPRGEIYATLLPRAARAVVGQVGPESRGVEHMLRAIGFRYADRVDPFDGGPHFVASTDEITLVSAARPLAQADSGGCRVAEGALALVGRDLDKPPWFEAAVITGERLVALRAGAPGSLWVAPLG